MSSAPTSPTTDAAPASPLGDWVRATRTAQGLSQRALASNSGLSRSYVCDIERGRGLHPSVETLDKLAAALGFSRVDLLKASGVIEPVNDRRENTEERRMLSVFRDLSDKGRISVMQYARFIHTDEHQWTQADLLDGFDLGDGHAQPHRTPDTLTRPLFDDSDIG